MRYMVKPYYPLWLDDLADDVTLEAAAMDGTARGAEDVRTILVAARQEYEHQEFTYAGPCGENGFLEDYSSSVRGVPTHICRPGRPQRRRADPARPGEPPAT